MCHNATLNCCFFDRGSCVLSRNVQQADRTRLARDRSETKGICCDGGVLTWPELASFLPSGYDVYIAMVFRWPIEIDGLPNLKMVDLSIANC